MRGSGLLCLLRISLRSSREEDPEDYKLLLSSFAYRRTEKEEHLLCTLLRVGQQRSEKKTAENPDFCCRTTGSSFKFLLQRGSLSPSLLGFCFCLPIWELEYSLVAVSVLGGCLCVCMRSLIVWLN
ncbi:hypothetical protein MRB53_010486 [Persea americana]|uniref:Uncharacterized protein n=1 Tax=Persea americana TaxID=3435 RepID=A0ACC2LRZ6_PERAE|nr:hypothetical protein MRB53_010486 [Persea americana]